jgi:hypothetical protein
MAQKVGSCEVTPEFRMRMANAKHNVAAQVINDLNHYAVQLASSLRAGAAKDTGAMRAGIHPEFATESKPVVTIVSNANYTLDVDQGTRAHFPPVAALVGWSRRHKWPGVKDTASARKGFAEKQAKYKLEHPVGSKVRKKHYAATKSKSTHSKGKGAAERTEMTVEAQAFLIARAISKRGGKKQEFIGPVMKPAKAEIIRICQASLGKAKI